MQHRKIPPPDRASFDMIGPEILETLWEGLRHGHFEYQVVGTLETGNRRVMTIKAGRSFRYVIPVRKNNEDHQP